MKTENVLELNNHDKKMYFLYKFWDKYFNQKESEFLLALFYEFQLENMEK